MNQYNIARYFKLELQKITKETQLNIATIQILNPSLEKMKISLALAHILNSY